MATLQPCSSKKADQVWPVFYEADFILRLTDFQEWTPRVGEGTPCQLDIVCFGNSCWIASTATDDNSDGSKNTRQVWVSLLYKQELKPPLSSLYMVRLSYLTAAALFLKAAEVTLWT